MDEIIEKIRTGKFEELTRAAIMIIEEYRNQAGIYASAVMAEASTFNAEMENTFKPSVTKAEYRAKESVGSTKIMAEKEMRALEMLFDLVKMMLGSSHAGNAIPGALSEVAEAR